MIATKLKSFVQGRSYLIFPGLLYFWSVVSSSILCRVIWHWGSEVAGTMAAKRTADLIPLCHPLPYRLLGLIGMFSVGSNRFLGRLELACEFRAVWNLCVFCASWRSSLNWCLTRATFVGGHCAVVGTSHCCRR